VSGRTVLILCVLTVALFLGLAYYGWTHRWGGPAGPEVKGPPTLLMPRMDQVLDLKAGGFDDSIWGTLTPLTVDLFHQVTAAPRARSRVPRLDMRAFHNGRDAYFLFEWPDERESRTHGVATFPDGVAVALSLSRDQPGASIMMGFESPLNFWQWKADLDAQFWDAAERGRGGSPNVHYTYEETAAFPVRAERPSSACQDLLAERPGTVTRKKTTRVSGRGRWHDGKWRVIIKRPLVTTDTRNDAQLLPGALHIAFAVWNGEKGDRGSRKSISDWVILDVRSDPAGGLSGFSLMPSAYGAEPTSDAAVLEPRLIVIKAKRFEYEPSRITVQKGERVTIRLESLDVTHGLYLDGYGVKMKANPAEVGKATFVADKTGRFTFRCSETCGEFHPYMIGYLTVEPNVRFHVFVAATVAVGVVLVLVRLLVVPKREGAV